MKCDSLNIYIFDSSSTLPIMFGVRFHPFRIPSHTPKTHCIQFLCASFRFAISMCNVNIALFDAFGIAILFITPRLLAGVSLSCCFACYVHIRYYYIRARSFFFVALVVCQCTALQLIVAHRACAPWPSVGNFIPSHFDSFCVFCFTFSISPSHSTYAQMHGAFSHLFIWHTHA